MLRWYFYGKNGVDDKAKYNALTEEQKKFFHEGLGLYMMCCEIGHVSEMTIPILVQRINMQGLSTETINIDHLKPFIGVVANVSTMGSKEFYALKFKSTNVTTKQLDSDWTEFRKKLEKEHAPKKPGDDLNHVTTMTCAGCGKTVKTKHWKACRKCDAEVAPCCQGSYLIKGVCGNCKY